MFNIRKIVQIIVGLLIFGAIIGLLYYLIVIIPIPAPYQGWILLALKVMAVLAVIGMLLDWAGFPIIKRNGDPLNPPG